MAKISAHGKEIGTVYFTVKAKRYMSDGTVLINSGFGWKLGPKLKAGVTPQKAYDRQVAHQREELAKRPATVAYRKELHELAGVSKRWKLHMAVELMPNDPDGVWSEACDGYGDNCSADIDEVAHLCMLYKNAVAETARLRETVAA
jgi:hypothetical protein